MKTQRTLIGVLAAAALLAGCASPGTRVTTSSDAYRDMAKSQQVWCNTFSDSCACTIDGNRATCNLVYTCVNAGSCKTAP